MQIDSVINDSCTEALAILGEECGEVVQVLGKISRHGINSCNPHTKITNSRYLHVEAADVLLAVDLLLKLGVLSSEELDECYKLKLRKLQRSLHYINLKELGL